jgi:hypothetical protein
MDELNNFNNPNDSQGSEEMESKETEPVNTSQPEEQSKVEENPKEEAEINWLIENKFRNDEEGREKLAESYKSMQSLKDKAEGTLKSQESEYERLKQLDQFLKDNPTVRHSSKRSATN